LLELLNYYYPIVSYKLQVLLRTERATALITQKIEKEDKENIER